MSILFVYTLTNASHIALQAQRNSPPPLPTAAKVLLVAFIATAFVVRLYLSILQIRGLLQFRRELPQLLASLNLSATPFPTAKQTRGLDDRFPTLGQLRVLRRSRGTIDWFASGTLSPSYPELQCLVMQRSELRRKGVKRDCVSLALVRVPDNWPTVAVTHPGVWTAVWSIVCGKTLKCTSAEFDKAWHVSTPWPAFAAKVLSPRLQTALTQSADIDHRVQWLLGKGALIAYMPDRQGVDNVPALLRALAAFIAALEPALQAQIASSQPETSEG